ncbi:MAG: sigma-70 family RNA polymerase sigma factor [Pseudomonadota bacterium]
MRFAALENQGIEAGSIVSGGGRRMKPQPISTQVNILTSFDSDMKAVAGKRDRIAFKRIFDHFAPRVKAYLKRVGSGDEIAEDLAQETLLAVWRRAHQFDRSKAALSTWIFTIARNKRIDALRKEKRPEHDAEDPLRDEVSAPRGDDYVQFTQIQSIIREAVSTLPREQAELLKIFYFEEKTHTAIAEEYDIPLGTVKSRLRLALSKLRVALGGAEI